MPAAHTVRLNIEALSRPIPTSNYRPLISDYIQWEIMSQLALTSRNASPHSRVMSGRSVPVSPLSIETSSGRFVPENDPPLSPTSSATSALPGLRWMMVKPISGLIKSSKAPSLPPPPEEPMPFLYMGIVKDAGPFEHLVARLVSDSGKSQFGVISHKM